MSLKDKSNIGSIPLVSVVLPVFNGEDTVSWTINSVLRQTFNDLELICIDDCSTDKTVNILHDMARSDERVKVIYNNINKGSGESRNQGINHARGEYVAFIDSDDLYEPDFIQKLYDLAITENADIAQCAVRYVYDNKNKYYGSPAGKLLGEHCKYRIDINDGLPFINPQAWNKIYKRTLFSDVDYLSICYEDAEILPSLLSKVESVVVSEEPLINYNKRYSGLTGEKIVPVSKVDWYLESLLVSIEPYYTPSFISMLKKWSASCPRCTYENHKNFFKMLDRSFTSYSYTEKKIVADKIIKHLIKIKEVAPHSYYKRYLGIAEGFLSEKGFGGDLSHSKLFKWFNGFAEKVVYKVEKIFPSIDFFTPKKDDIWVFSSWGKYSSNTLDNPRAVLEFIKYDSSIKKVVIINVPFKDEDLEPVDGENIEFVYLKSLKSLYYLARAGVVITGYSLHNIFAYKRLLNLPSRKIIQLWHGVPVKKVGLEVSQNLEKHWSTEVERYSMLISSSRTDRETMIKSFSPDNDHRVKLTGLPRHDFITCDVNKLPKDYQDHLAKVKERIGKRKLILFAPTWRYNGEQPCSFSYPEMKKLDLLLKKNNAVLGVRLHPNMKKAGVNSSYLSNNIFNVDDIPDANIILRLADMVISDYSSIYIDFMASNKPVILYTNNISGYMEVRGFNYPPEDFIPHASFYDDFNDVFKAVSNFLSGAEVMDEKYYKVKSLFLTYANGSGNSDRVVSAIREL